MMVWAACSDHARLRGPNAVLFHTSFTQRLAFPAGLEPAYLRVRSALLIQLSYGKMIMALPAGLEPASTG